MPKLASKALTDTLLRTMKAPKKRMDIYDAVVRGLGIRVAERGTKTCFVMKRVNGTNNRISLGRCPAIPLQDARTQTQKLIAQIESGLPLQAPADTTVREAVEEWYKREQGAKRSASEKRRAL